MATFLGAEMRASRIKVLCNAIAEKKTKEITENKTSVVNSANT